MRAGAKLHLGVWQRPVKRSAAKAPLRQVSLRSAGLDRRQVAAKLNRDCGRCTKRLQNDAASLCRGDKSAQMGFRQVIHRLNFDFHVTALKADGNAVAGPQGAAHIGAKARVNLEMLQLYPLDVGDQADRRIQATCQRRGQQFARAGKIAFSADGLVH